MFHVKTPRKNSPQCLSPCCSARAAAFLTLDRCSLYKPVQAALHEVLDQIPLSVQDKALATELVYGYLRSEISLHWLVSRYLKAPEKLPPPMLRRLECATYELFCLDRIPVHATVDVTVTDIRKQFGQSLARVANGVLRNLARLHEQEGALAHVLDQLTEHENSLTPLERLEITSGVPHWILSLWSMAYDEESARQLARSASRTPWPCIRINRLRPAWHELLQDLCSPAPQSESPETTQKTESGPKREQIGFSGVRFPPGVSQALWQRHFLVGDISRQGGGSQILLKALLGENPGEEARCIPLPAEQINRAPLTPRLETWYQEKPFWDACAGYGGKTFALAELGLHIHAASDVNLSRLQGLRREAQRLRFPPPPIFCASAAAPALLQGKRPPLILLDAPCSGLGTLARRPDVRRLRHPEQLPQLVDVQKRLLRACWEMLPPGGRLIYMTCTVTPEENERQVQAFLVEHTGAELYREWQGKPDDYGTDLMYGAVLRKTDSRALSPGQTS